MVPKIIVPEAKSPGITIEHHKSESQVSRLSDSTRKSTESESVEKVVSDVLDSILTKIEQGDENNEIQASPIMPHHQDDDLIIENCVFYVKQFFHTFVKSHLFGADGSLQDRVSKSFSSLFKTGDEANLANSVRLSDVPTLLVNSEELTDEPLSFTSIQLKPDSLNFLYSFQILNKFLVKLLFFPRETGLKNLDESLKETDFFEDWLKDLLVLSCSARLTKTPEKLFEFQSVSINTLLELVHLSESVNSHFKRTTRNETIIQPTSKNICLVQTVFNSKQMELIYSQSHVGLIIAKMLWSHLNPELPMQTQIMTSSSHTANDKRAAILFCLLHETLPNNLCEDIIAQSLVSSVFGLSQQVLNRLMKSLKLVIDYILSLSPVPYLGLILSSIFDQGMVREEI